MTAGKRAAARMARVLCFCENRGKEEEMDREASGGRWAA
jgi:hypothetical protein